MKQVPIPGTERTLPVIGQGTWGMGQSRAHRTRDILALRLGISLGMTLIDTAEYYATGGAEEVVGEAVADCRDKVYLVTKVWPSHAGYDDALDAVRGSLRRLRTDHIDAVLLHWPTRSVPLVDTFRAFSELQTQGAIGCFGVSNFTLRWLRAAEAARPVFNQVPYSLRNRRVENAILPYAHTHGQIVMAWSPLGHGRMRAWAGYPALAAIAALRGVTPQQVALAFLTARPNVLAIPKAVTPDHVRSNAAAGDLDLAPEDLARLDAAFPRSPQAGLPLLPPYDAFFRLAWWAGRLQGRGAASPLSLID